MTRHRRHFTVERRALPPRAPVQQPQSAQPARESNVPATPVAREVYFALRTAPIRFPKMWIQT